MSSTVDYLPAWYSGKTLRRQATRERLLLAVPVILALAVVDVVLRIRVASVRGMLANAKEHAAYGVRVGQEATTLAARARELQTTLEGWARPMATRRMTELLDELLRARPGGITLHELAVHHAPWTESAVPSFGIAAVSATADDLQTWLDLLRASDVLPPLQCQRTDQGRNDAAFGFSLDNKAAGRRVR